MSTWRRGRAYMHACIHPCSRVFALAINQHLDRQAGRHIDHHHHHASARTSHARRVHTKPSQPNTQHVHPATISLTKQTGLRLHLQPRRHGPTASTRPHDPLARSPSSSRVSRAARGEARRGEAESATRDARPAAVQTEQARVGMTDVWGTRSVDGSVVPGNEASLRPSSRVHGWRSRGRARFLTSSRSRSRSRTRARSRWATRRWFP